MKEDQAKELFRGKAKLNCAQAVLAVFKSEDLVTDDDLEKAATAGGGKAEGGVCGAVYALRHIVKDPDTLKRIESDLEEQGGSLLCRQIRKQKVLSCRDYVGLTARLIDES